MMKCFTCGDTRLIPVVDTNPTIPGVFRECPDCTESVIDFHAELPASNPDGVEDEIWTTSQQKVYVRNLKRFVSFVDWDKQLLDFGISYDDFTCAKCYLADKCRSAFDSYNTNGDCLEEK